MPKLVDPRQRREEIADAVFALVDRGGIEEASLRNVAAQAELNVGSVRHYVDGQQGMLVDAVRIMGERVEARIMAKVAAAPDTTDQEVRAEFAIDLLEELLPLDEERRLEVVVWLAFTERSRIVPELREEARTLLDGSRQVSRPILEAAGCPEPDLATETLACTVDGLTIALAHSPERLTRAQVRTILRQQLAACVAWGDAGPR